MTSGVLLVGISFLGCTLFPGSQHPKRRAVIVGLSPTLTKFGFTHERICFIGTFLNYNYSKFDVFEFDKHCMSL